MKEQTKKNTPLIIAVIIVGCFILAALIGIIWSRARMDTEGAAEDLLNLWNRTHVESYELVSNSIHKLSIDPDFWDGLSQDQKLEYCSTMLRNDTAILWNHHVISSPNFPTIRFYSNGQQVAETDGETVKVYK